MAEVSNADYMRAFAVYRTFQIYKASVLPRYVDFIEAPLGAAGLDMAGRLRTVEVTEVGKQRVEWLLGPHAEAMLWAYCAQQNLL